MLTHCCPTVWLLGSQGGYVQDKVRSGTGREGALGYERYVAGAGTRLDREPVERVAWAMRSSDFFQTGTEVREVATESPWRR